MRNTLIVIRHEVTNTIARFSFLFAAFGIPLISALLFAVASALNRDTPTTDLVAAIINPETAPKEVVSEGYIDESELMRFIPAPMPEGRKLQAYPDETAAQQALEKGEISAYYMIPRNYLATGELIYVQPVFDLSAAFDKAKLVRWILHVNLLGGDTHLANQVENPLNLEITVLEPASQRDADDPLTFALPYAVMMIYYMIFLMTAGLLLNSITKEKENRMLEILMSALTPRQLLTGKIVGLGLVGLLQVALWAGTGYTLLRLSGRTFEIPDAFQLPPSILVWGLVFFLLGYAVYASLMAAVGALVPNLREASHLTLVVLLPVIVPAMMSGLIIAKPNIGLSIGLSLFPLTAPVAMMTRLATADIPLWQPFTSASLLAATAVLIMHVVANMFRAQALLSGQPFSFQRLLNALRGRA